MGAIVPLSEGEGEEAPGDWDDVIMNIAAEIIKGIRDEVESVLGYTCSAGIARNKMLAKLAAGWKKPNQQVLHSETFYPETLINNSRLFYEIVPYWGF